MHRDAEMPNLCQKGVFNFYGKIIYKQILFNGALYYKF